MAVFNIKGQTSIEFLLIILIMLIYLFTVINPALQNSSTALLDTKRVAQNIQHANIIADNINEIGSLSGDSKKTFWVFVPEKSSIDCDVLGKKIDYVIELENPAEVESCSYEQDENGEIQRCRGNIKLNYSLNSCFTILNGNETPKAKIIISKTGEQINVQATE